MISCRFAARLLLFCGAVSPVLLWSQPAVAATVAFGSYVNAEFAAAQAARVEGLLGVATRLVPVRVRGVDYVRVVGPAAMSAPAARQLLRQAGEAGLSGVWFVAIDAAEQVAGIQPAGMPTARVPPEQTVPEQTVPEQAVREQTVPAASAAAASPRAAEPADRNAVPTTAAAPGAAGAEGTRGEVRDTPPAAVDAPAAPDPSRDLLLNADNAGEQIRVPGFERGSFEFQLDGRMDEAVWTQVPGYGEMTVVEPDTLAEPRHNTVVRYFFTRDALYVGMYAEQPRGTLIERLSSRDEYFIRDSMSITLDTSGHGLYGYWFSVALGGSLSDGKIAPERQYSREWDGPWNGASAQHDTGWSAELVLPWSMMAMPQSDANRQMGLYISRQVGYLDERFGFPSLPSTGARFMSAMQPLALPGVQPRQQLDFYPFVSGTHDLSRDDDDGKAGIDVFWRPSTNLQFSATLNPDFGAVESDDVVVNLTATETFFPEKRLFFLEGNEIFATTSRAQTNNSGGLAGARRTTVLFSPEPTQVVNTRRIGGAGVITVPDDVTIAGFERSRPTELLGAVKVTGQLGGLRYGVLGAFEDDVELIGTRAGREVMLTGDGREFGVLRGLYERTGRGRQSIGYIGTHVSNPIYDATVHGVDGHYLSGNGKLSVDAQLLGSDVDSAQGYGAMLDVNYTQRRGLLHTVRLDALDDKLNIDDLGFLRRNDYYGGVYLMNLTRTQGLPAGVRSFRFNFLGSYWENGDGQAVRSGVFFRNNITFNNQFEVRTETNYFPGRWEDLESEGNGAYRTEERYVADIAFGTNTANVLSFSGRMGGRHEELGDWTWSGALGLTLKPNDRFSFDLDLNYFLRDGWLLHQSGRDFTTFEARDFQPRLAMDMFLSARQQLRLTMQWAGIKAEEQEFFVVPDGGGDLLRVLRPPGAPSDDFVVNRITAQLRYRWQIAPLSDLFVVYTRGSNFSSSIDDSFGDLFNDAFENPVVDVFVIKLRYRFGL